MRVIKGDTRSLDNGSDELERLLRTGNFWTWQLQLIACMSVVHCCQQSPRMDGIIAAKALRNPKP